MRERRGGAERERERWEGKGGGRMGGGGGGGMGWVCRRGPLRERDGCFWPVEEQRAGRRCTDSCKKVGGQVNA